MMNRRDRVTHLALTKPDLVRWLIEENEWEGFDDLQGHDFIEKLRSCDSDDLSRLLKCAEEVSAESLIEGGVRALEERLRAAATGKVDRMIASLKLLGWMVGFLITLGGILGLASHLDISRRVNEVDKAKQEYNESIKALDKLKEQHVKRLVDMRQRNNQIVRVFVKERERDFEEKFFGLLDDFGLFENPDLTSKLEELEPAVDTLRGLVKLPRENDEQMFDRPRLRLYLGLYDLMRRNNVEWNQRDLAAYEEEIGLWNALLSQPPYDDATIARQDQANVADDMSIAYGSSRFEMRAKAFAENVIATLKLRQYYFGGNNIIVLQNAKNRLNAAMSSDEGFVRPYINYATADWEFATRRLELLVGAGELSERAPVSSGTERAASVDEFVALKARTNSLREMWNDSKEWAEFAAAEKLANEYSRLAENKVKDRPELLAVVYHNRAYWRLARSVLVFNVPESELVVLGESLKDFLDKALRECEDAIKEGKAGEHPHLGHMRITKAEVLVSQVRAAPLEDGVSLIGRLRSAKADEEMYANTTVGRRLAKILDILSRSEPEIRVSTFGELESGELQSRYPQLAWLVDESLPDRNIEDDNLQKYWQNHVQKVRELFPKAVQ